MQHWLVTLFEYLILAEVVTAAYFWVVARRLSRASMHLVRIQPGQFLDQLTHAWQCEAWARSRGFRQVGCFVLDVNPRKMIAAWEDPATGRWLAIYYYRRPIFDLITVFNDGLSVGTNNSPAGGLFPCKPGDYAQSFVRADLDELWRRHTEAEGFIMEAAQVAPRTDPRNFELEFPQAVRAQMLYVRSLPLYPFRVLPWFVVRRARYRNRSVQEQCARGLAIPPTALRA